jgi:hypothetical protein
MPVRRGDDGAAYVVAVSMGYGHERAASALRSIAVGKKIILANDYPDIPAKDKKIWSTGQTWYERISRFKRVPIVGRAAFGVMDHLQEIEPFYPRRDLSAPTLQVKQTYALIRKAKNCKHLIDKLAERPKPLICTFMTPAFAAEEFGYPEDIYLVICDADVSRAWVPLDPRKSRIKYLAPTGRVVERLRLYGVRKENILFTGFPLPMENVGGPQADTALTDLSRRMCNLDPNGVFAQHARSLLHAKFGQDFCDYVAGKRQTPVSLTFAVGGAGAQREMGIQAAKSLARDILDNKLTLNLVAGTRPEVGEYFSTELLRTNLKRAVADGRITILSTPDRAAYFADFNKLIRKTDILWTKPSELSFYTGLGLPILMAPTVGSQEDFNRNWLFQVGGGTDALNPALAGEWLWDWIRGGALARMAWNGYTNAPTHGAYRIEDIARGREWLMHELPLVV